MNSRILTLLLALTLAVSSGMGQVTTGDLQARIVDTSGAPLPGANLVVRGAAIQGNRGSASDTAGFITVVFLPPGKATVRISHLGFQTIDLLDVSIRLGNTTYLGDIMLKPGSINMPEIVVSAGESFADASKSSTGLDLQSSDFEKLPIERNYRSIATLVPQANASFLNDEVNVGGATGRENKYFVDGMDVTDPSFSKVGTNLPYNFIKEINVTTGGYQAEYRGSMGGLINVVTYSGSNKLHGSAFGFFTNNGLTASRRGVLIDPNQGPFSDYDVGVGIGGPIIRDDLWFYAAYNPTFKRKEVEIPGIGTQIDRALAHSFAGKLTWRASERLNVILTSTGDPGVRKAVGDAPSVSEKPLRLENIDPYLSDETEGGINLSLNGTYFAADGILLDASISRVTRNQKWEPSTETGKTSTVLIDVPSQTWSGGSFGHLSFFRSSTIARSSATVISGNHTLKGGAEYRRSIQDANLDYPIFVSRYSDSLYKMEGNGTHANVENRTYSGFLQDHWQAFHNLGFHAGLRWDGQLVFGANGKVVHRIRGLLQPRFGFVFQPEERWKVFGSFGRFAQEWSSALMTIYTYDSYYRSVAYTQDPRVGNTKGTIQFEIPGGIPDETTLQAQHYDEVSLGCERTIGTQIKVTLQGIFRKLRQSIDGGAREGVGNPGEGVLAAYPKPRREYTALVVTIEQRMSERLSFLASYVLSRNYGNYEGLYDSYNGNIVPNVDFLYFYAGNTPGLLPNDRTHVFKFSGSYVFPFGLVAGTTCTWESGTPLNEIAGQADIGEFLRPRGTAGRTPSLWDLNARLIYPLSFAQDLQSRLILDVFHIASQRKPVEFDQEHYGIVNDDGSLSGPNPGYATATGYQPPMSVRLGMEVSF